MSADPPQPREPVTKGDKEILNDGQEEVFSRTAVEKGLVKDPKAMDPKDVRSADGSPRKADS